MAQRTSSGAEKLTVDASEVRRFSALAAEWWDPDGKFRPLHRLNPVRLAYLRDHIAGQFGRDLHDRYPLAGLRILDVGCGGGLVSEPLARMGARVLGIDAAEESIRVAAAHAAHVGLEIDYRVAAVEELAAAGEQFDAVIALEIIEHVPDLDHFVGSCADVCQPGGPLIFATINRTIRSYLLAIVGAEYVLRWLPRGTHDWNRFVRPSELAGALAAHGARILDLSGAVYDPLGDEWRIARDLAVNYLAFAVKDGG